MLAEIMKDDEAVPMRLRRSSAISIIVLNFFKRTF